ncbi:PAS domain-containing hybrid sensor histidine kinase/response regulator [Sphingobacterium sp. 2149]|uniref:PAS domain-containing hybrid sensor histidine kinase/response regulator n=1 Tax=Sphingobacterium sp. 2149 TaxID=2817763 RepID=UPI001AE3A90C|nr:PAS domain-containing hybrid sensor histidine kinase/response regulator [Sphingobacterium sp. 2149]MDR6736691.1 PAS domain S-box-containing protein [Sphingobacterium sp. 2149]
MHNQKYPKNENTFHFITDQNYRLIADMIKDDFFRVLLKAKLICYAEMAILTLFDNNRNFVGTYFHDAKGNVSVDKVFLDYMFDDGIHSELSDLKNERCLLRNSVVFQEYNIMYYLEIPLKNPDGKTVGFLSVMDSNVRDIDDNQHTVLSLLCLEVLELLYDRNSRFNLSSELAYVKSTIDMTSKVARVGGWEYDLIEHSINWSEMTRTIHGVSMDYNPTVETAIDFYKDPQHRMKIVRAMNDAIFTGTPWDLELEIETYQGQRLWVRVLGNAAFDNGKCVRLYGTFQDVDKRKRSEEDSMQSKKLLEDVLNATTPVGIIATDSEGLITLFNRGAENLLGYRSEEVIGKISPTLFHSSNEIKGRANELEIELGYPVSEFRVFVENAERYGSEQREWIYVKKDLTQLYVSVAVTAIRDISDQIIGYLCIATDITKSVLQREELKKAKKLADQGSEAKSEFLANMSHEIRTPLNGIIGFTDLMSRTKLDVTQKEYLSIIDQSANLLLGVINDILDFSKIEAGKLELLVEKSDLYEMLAQLTSLIDPQLKIKKLDFKLSLSESLPHYIWVDTLRLKQVLMNLLSNALKFTEKGKIELLADVLSSDSNTTTLRFSVTDTGMGIKPDRQEKIFEAFSQEDASISKTFGGTGLGLSISNQLLKMMSSQLKLESEYGEGSKFYFEITIRSLKGEVYEWKLLESLHMLIVAREDTDRANTALMLNMKKVNVSLADNGFEVLQLLAKGHRYDMIIIDHDLPVMNGIDTIKKIREKLIYNDTEQPIVLMLSTVESNASDSTKSEFTPSINKPFKIDQLYSVLVGVLKQHVKSVRSNDEETIFLESKHKILIIEDNKFNMLLTHTIVQNLLPNAEIIEASDGVKGYELFKEHAPDLVFMDIQMPKMNGYELTKLIRENENQEIRTPIIALTASNIKGEKERCIAYGMDDFAVKPFVKKTLTELLYKWLPRY